MIKWTDRYSDRPDYEGCVLACPVWHPRAYSCDFETVYASVWTGDRVEDVDVGVGGYSNWDYWGSVTIDATDEVRELAKCWRREVDRKAAEWQQAVLDWTRATTIQRGDYVERISGRKPPVGTAGRVDYIGDTAYGDSVKVNGTWGGKPHTWRKVLSREHVDPITWRRVRKATELLDERAREVYAKHPYRLA